jgi:hypothetical protein
VTSHITDDFRRRLQALPMEVRQLARKNYRLWKSNPQHPSIRYKPVGGSVWSAHIGLAYRALAAKEGEIVV